MLLGVNHECLENKTQQDITPATLPAVSTFLLRDAGSRLFPVRGSFKNTPVLPQDEPRLPNTACLFFFVATTATEYSQVAAAQWEQLLVSR